jgi:hypothetical protein
MFEEIRPFIKSITANNGKEFSAHQFILESIVIFSLRTLTAHGKEDKMKN